MNRGLAALKTKTSNTGGLSRRVSLYDLIRNWTLVSGVLGSEGCMHRSKISGLKYCILAHLLDPQPRKVGTHRIGLGLNYTR